MHHFSATFVFFVSYFSHLGRAQIAYIQNNTFNSSYGQFNPSRIRARIAQANLSAAVSDALLVGLDFKRSNWAGSSTHLDHIPANSSNATAGSITKVEQYTNTSL